MVQYIIVIGFFILAFFLMGLALHFSKYKKRPSGCCGGGDCSNNADAGAISTNCIND